jgi:hypothetical protein
MNKAERFLASKRCAGALMVLSNLDEKDKDQERLITATNFIGTLLPIELAILYTHSSCEAVKHIPYLCARHSESLMLETSYLLDVCDRSAKYWFCKTEKLVKEYTDKWLAYGIDPSTVKLS